MFARPAPRGLVAPAPARSALAQRLRRTRQDDLWKVLLVAPVIGLIVLGSLLVTLGAAWENIQTSRATGQLIGILSEARSMTIDSRMESGSATTAFVELLKQKRDLELLPAASGSSAPRVASPWDGWTSVTILPAAQALRLETAVPARACRSLLAFLNQDLESLALDRVDIRTDGAMPGPWRLLYNVPPGAPRARFAPGTIGAGCGSDSRVVVSLAFRLR